MLGTDAPLICGDEQRIWRTRRTSTGSTCYESLDDPDLLIDIAEWESPEARTAHLAKAMAAGAYGPVLELLADAPGGRRGRKNNNASGDLQAGAGATRR